MYLRRLLVDEGYLARDSWGAAYQVAEPEEPPVLFACEVDGVDVYVTIGVGRKVIDQLKRERGLRVQTQT